MSDDTVGKPSVTCTRCGRVQRSIVGVPGLFCPFECSECGHVSRDVIFVPQPPKKIGAKK